MKLWAKPTFCIEKLEFVVPFADFVDDKTDGKATLYKVVSINKWRIPITGDVHHEESGART